MGFSDFSLQNNNGDKKLNEIKHGVRRDQIEAKFRNIFDIYDVNKDGTLESRELSELEKSLQDFAGEDKVLTEGENKVALTIFTSITGVKNVDISGFLKNLSDASELIESTSQTLGEDGGNIITTKYKDGGTEVIAYYPDGEYKFNSSPENYRIKQEPTLRPFISLEECWEEMHHHSEFGWLMKKDDGELTLIYGIYKDNNGNVMVKFGNDLTYNLNVVEVFYIYNFADGAPFGIMEG